MSDRGHRLGTLVCPPVLTNVGGKGFFHFGWGFQSFVFKRKKNIFNLIRGERRAVVLPPQHRRCPPTSLRNRSPWSVVHLNLVSLSFLLHHDPSDHHTTCIYINQKIRPNSTSCTLHRPLTCSLRSVYAALPHCRTAQPYNVSSLSLCKSMASPLPPPPSLQPPQPPHRLARTLCTPALLASSRRCTNALKSAFCSFLPPTPVPAGVVRLRERSRRASGPMIKR